MKMQRQILLLHLLILFSQKVQSVTVSGGSSISIQANGRETQITIADINIAAEGDLFRIEDNNEHFSLSPIWVLFGLSGQSEYNIRTWELAGNCGCSNQVCGEHCSGIKGIDCDSNLIDTPLTCMLSTIRGFCWGFVETGISQNYTRYNLEIIGVSALTTYPGLTPSFMNPGFTIRKRHQNENYSFNGMIKEITSRIERPLSSYVFAESEGKVILEEEFLQLTSKPKLTSQTVQIEASSCPQEGYPLFRSTRITPAVKQVDFRSYMILRRGNSNILTSLSNQNILSPNGVLKWKNQVTFDIFDPCNQQFLTLQRDEFRNIFVKLPATQRLLKNQIICVAINDVNDNIYDLALYEFKNSTSLFKTSDQFKGLLSQDYVRSLQVGLATQANLPLNVSTSTVDINFNLEGDMILLKLTTSLPLICEIFISPICHFNLTTTDDHLVITKSIQNSCGYWYETGHFLCEGIAGHFFAPSIYTKALISGFIENTTMTAFSTESISAWNIAINHSSSLISWWRKSNMIERTWWVFMLIALVLIITYMLHLFRQSKETRFIRVKRSDSDEFEELTNSQESSDNPRFIRDEKARNEFIAEESDDDDEFPVDYDAIVRRRLEIQKETKVCTDKYFQIYR